MIILTFKRQGGYLISKIHQLAGRIFAKILRENGITLNPGQGRIMFALWKKDNISINEISKETKLSKSTLTSMLDRLEEAELIRRVPDKNDRRTILIELTNKDKSMRDKYLTVSEEMNEIYYRGFSDKEAEEFEGYLRRVLGNLMEQG